MAKIVDNTVLDAALMKIQGYPIAVTPANTQMFVCSTQPTTYAEASTTYMLAAKTAIPSTDYAIADGTSGRRLTTTQYSGVSITNTGSAQHIAICNASVLLYVTTCTAQTINSGGTVTIPSWYIELADPT